MPRASIRLAHLAAALVQETGAPSAALSTHLCTPSLPGLSGTALDGTYSEQASAVRANEVSRSDDHIMRSVEQVCKHLAHSFGASPCESV